MKIAQVKEFNGITEFKNNKKSGDIKIYLYTLPVRDINSQHTENYAVTKELKRLNNCNHKIVFNEYMIGSFEEIVNWGDIKYKSLGFRAIDISIATEKGILERLLLEDIKSSIDTSIYELKKK